MAEDDKPKRRVNLLDKAPSPKKKKGKMAGAPPGFKKKKGLARRVVGETYGNVKDHYKAGKKERVEDKRKYGEIPDKYENQLGREIETEVGMLLNGQPYDPDAGLKPGKLKFVINAKRADGQVKKHERDFDLNYLFEKKKAILSFFQDQKFTHSFEIEKDDAKIWVAIYDENDQGINDLKIKLKVDGKVYDGMSAGGGTTFAYVEFKIPDLDVGKHNTVAELVDNPLYEADPVKAEIIIKEKFNIEFVTVQNGGELEGGKEIGLEWRVSDKKLVKHYKLYLVSEGKELSEKTVSGKHTTNTWEIPDIDAENCYFVIRSFDKHKKMLGEATSDEPFNIKKLPRKLTAEFNDDIEIDEGEDVRFEVKVKDVKTKKPRGRVLVIVNWDSGEVRDHTGTKGIANILIKDLPVGKHSFTVKLEHKDYPIEEDKGTITVKEQALKIWFKKGYDPHKPVHIGQNINVVLLKRGDNFDQVYITISKGRTVIKEFNFNKNDVFESMDSSSIMPLEGVDKPGEYELIVVARKDGSKIGEGGRSKFTVGEGEGPLPPGGNGGITINIINITNIYGLYDGRDSLINLFNQLLQKINILIEIKEKDTTTPSELVQLLQNINLSIMNVIQLLNQAKLDLEVINKELNNIQILLQQLINQGPNDPTINNMIKIINNIVNQINIKIGRNEKKKKKTWGPHIYKFMKNLKGKSEVSYVLIFEGHSRSVTIKVNQVLRALERADLNKITKGDMKKINIFKEVMMRYHEKFKSNRPYFNSVREEFAKLDKKLDVDDILKKLMNEPIQKELKELLYTNSKTFRKRDMDRLRTIVRKAKNESKLIIINTDKLKKILIKYGLIHA